MKIRNGFVSNSSSSSFVIVVNEDTHETVMKTLTKYQQDCMKTLAGKSKNVFNRKCKVIGEFNDRDGTSSLIEDGWQPDGWEETIEKASENDEDYCPVDALYDYIDAVEKHPKSTWFKWEI